MSKDELTKWFMDEFWPQYIHMMKTPYVTKWKGGQRGEALQKILKLNPSTELRSTILGAIQAQTIHRASLYKKLGNAKKYEAYTKYDKFYSNRNGSTWLNQLGWHDEIPSLMDLQEHKPISDARPEFTPDKVNRSTKDKAFSELSALRNRIH